MITVAVPAPSLHRFSRPYGRSLTEGLIVPQKHGTIGNDLLGRYDETNGDTEAANVFSAGAAFAFNHT